MCDNKYMKRIGIFGGTFDPVHNEHIKMAEIAVKELNLDRLFVMPTFIPPHKTEAKVSAKDRLKMLKLAFFGKKKIKVSDYEIKKGGKSYSYETVNFFREKYPDSEIFLVVGADMMKDFPTWKNPDLILKNCTLAVFGRENCDADFDKENINFINRFGERFIRLSYDGAAVSSTKVRVYASFKLPITEFVPKKVARYIEKKGLYRGDIYTEFITRNLKETRVIHTAGVVVAALSKAKELSLREEKVRIAATLHDCAKYLDPARFKGFILPDGVPAPVVHAFLGAFVAEHVLGVKDKEIIDAVKYHTSGKADMSDLSKLIFVADMVEEGRTYDGVEKLRTLFEKDFRKCFIECIEDETDHLIKKGKPIFIETINAYDFYVKNKEN